MLSNRGSKPALCSHLSKTQVDKFDKNSETFKIQIQKDAKIQTEIISHSKVTDG